jgi:hypothetical protein
MIEHSPRVGSLEYARNLKTYVPKVGDKARATLGETRLVGEIVEAPYAQPPESIRFTRWLWAEDCAQPFQLRLTDGWLFEQLVSVPTKFGAVIRRADGEVFVLAEPNAADSTDWFGEGSGWHRANHATAGGFTILFDGVDE